MQRKKIEKAYIKKINELKKHDEAYFEQDSPIISDKDYDIIKQEILNLEKKYNYLKNKNLGNLCGRSCRLIVNGASKTNKFFCNFVSTNQIKNIII